MHLLEEQFQIKDQPKNVAEEEGSVIHELLEMQAEVQQLCPVSRGLGVAAVKSFLCDGISTWSWVSSFVNSMRKCCLIS